METVPCPVCNQAGYKGTAWSGDYDGKEWYVLQKRPKQGDRRYMGVRGSRVGEHREREAADEA